MPTGRRCFNLSDVSCSTFRNQATEGHLFHSGPSVRDRLDDVIGRDQVLPALLRLQEDGRRQVDVEGGVETRTVKFFNIFGIESEFRETATPVSSFRIFKGKFQPGGSQFFSKKQTRVPEKKPGDLVFGPGLVSFRVSGIAGRSFLWLVVMGR